MRQQAAIAGGIPIAVRHVESILRIAEAHAKMHLREQVRHDDVNVAIRVMLSSFIGAQKYEVKNTLEKKFQKYMLYQRPNDELLFYILKQMVKDEIQRQALDRQEGDNEEDFVEPSDDEADDAEREASRRKRKQVSVSVEELKERAREYDIHDVASFFESNLFVSNRFSVEGDDIVRTF